MHPSQNFFKLNILFFIFHFSTSSLVAQFTFAGTTGDTVIFINKDVGSPSLYEACIGSDIELQYIGFSNHPNRVYLTDRAGQLVLINAVAFTSGPGGGGNRSGTIEFTIPDNVTSGKIELHRGGGGSSFLFQLPSIIIQNPVIDFLPQSNPICASDSAVSLYSIPSGGTFSTTGGNFLAGFLVDTLMNATQAGWNTDHDTFIVADVQYSYYPNYSDGTLCLDSIIVTKPITIYDNRLNTLAFSPLVKDVNPFLNDRILTLDSAVNASNTNIISIIEPNLFYDSTGGNIALHPYSFSGTFVNGSSTFLGNVAGPSNPITLEFNNNGCIGSLTADLDVYEPLVIENLPDTLCEQASPVNFFRDTTLVYSSTSTTNIFFTTTTIEENKVIGVVTADPNHQAAFTVVSLAGGNEEFSFNPNLLPANTQQVVLSMLYRNSTTVSPVFGTPRVRADTFQALDVITIIPRPTLSFLNVQSAYCADGSSDTLKARPIFEYRSRTRFSLVGADSSNTYNLPISIIQDSILIPDSIYRVLVPNGNRNLPMRLTYTVDRYGCSDNVTANFEIRAPLYPSFLAKPAYCKNESPSLLQRNVLTSGVQESWSAIPGLDTSNGSFNPVLATSSENLVTYTLTDQFGCVYDFTDTLFVRDPPRIELTLDGSTTNTIFCANPVFIDIRSRLITGSIIDSIEYFGAGVIDSTLNPNSVFAGGGGTSIIWTEATDGVGCKAYDTLRITIIQAPSIDIDVDFNNIPTFGAIRSEHTYCKSDDPFPIDGRPRYIDVGGAVRGSITGAGVKLLNTTYFYDPTQVPTGTLLDTVRYTYTDSIGCVNTELAIVKLDSVPIVSLTGFLDTNFCLNSDTLQLRGIPDTSTSLGSSFYAGPGVNPNTGLFTPSRSGTGSKSIIYEFRDSKGCVDSDTVKIVVNGLPTPKFTGYQYQYCTADSADRLWSLNDTTTGSYYFYGNIITDSVGILNANDSTTGPQNVYYAYVDSNNCTNVDSINIFIHPTPEIEISGLDSAYCYNDPIDRITVVPAGIRSNLTGDTAFFIQANTISFTPNVGPPGVKSFTYSFTDNNGCGNDLVVRTYVHQPVQPTVTGLDTFQCETSNAITINGAPYWGTFSGSGIISNFTRPIDSIWGFVPSNAGVGIHNVTYTVLDTFQLSAAAIAILGNRYIADSVCSAERVLTINVRSLPNPKFIGPLNNTRFCSNDAAAILLPDTLNPVWDNFRDTSGGVSFTIDSVYVPLPNGLFKFVPDTTYFFDPAVVVPGIHLITYIATDSISQCQDSLQITYIVDEYIEASFTLDSVYCASNPPVLLNATPGGGLFTRNSTILNPNLTSPFFNFDPTATTVVIDTVVYAIEYGACEDTITKVVVINPLPQLNFTTINAPYNTYCLGDPPVALTTTNIGGTFAGSPGVLAGDYIFYPDLAGAGSHKITFEYTDSATSCSNTFSDTLHVYGRPNLDFAVAGGCQYDSIFFNPNNAILDLDNTDQSRVVDSITSIQWIFSPAFSTTGTSQSIPSRSAVGDSMDIIDSIGYVYNTAGVYFTQLIVANRIYCADTQTVRLVISPKVNSFPYEQDFESSAGDWFAESRDSSHRLLWEWGVDNNPLGVGADPANHIWATQTNAAYQGDEDAWVYSPCFDLDSLDRPMISMDYWTDTRQSVDGTVLEYQRDDGTWAPVGFMDRGINWFNSPFISGQPGDQIASNLLGTGWTAPLGWSGEGTGWQNGRYKLDDFRGAQNTVRLRISFASPAIQPNGFYDGFAFDNVIVRNRTRNVLLETMSNIGFGSMEVINNHTYQLVHHTALNKDVVLLQYHVEGPTATDAFYLNNASLGRNRAYEYGGSPPGRAFIDGDDSTRTYNSLNLRDADFEQDMLETPKFKVMIDTFVHINNTFNVRARVEAEEAMPFADYRIYVVISEDSLNYPSGTNYLGQVHAVVRENDQFHLDPSVNSANTYRQNWASGEQKRVDFVWNHSNSGFINYSPNNKRFQAVVFIQNSDSKEIFQVASTRDVSGYWVGIDPIEAAPQLTEIQNVNLFPNPAHDYFNLRFDQMLTQDYQWKLVNMLGVEVRQGEIRAGTEQVTIDGLDYPSGAYIMVLYNENVFVQRQVILGRP